MISRLLNIGITRDTPEYLASTLRTATISYILLSVIMVVFIAVFSVVAPVFLPIFISELIILVFSLSIQAFGYHIVARLLTTVTIGALAVIYFCMVASQTTLPLHPTFAACILVSLFPWYVFSINEWIYAAIASSVNSALAMSSNFLIPFFAVTSDLSVAANPVIQNLTLVAALIAIAGTTIGLQITNRNEGKKVRALLREREKENRLAEEKENALTEAMAQLKHAQREDQKRAWEQRGITEAAKILRENSDLPTITDRLISFLVKYLNANQGALFLISQSDDPYLELRGCYAYDRKKYIDKKINVGDGLLGQCYFERTPIILTDVPQNYMHITSGLGHATPKAVAVIPIITNEKFLGAYEFASFTPFEQHQIKFLQEVAENAAITFTNIHVSEQTQSLLQETKLMTEQMKAQELEMRQNMEEIVITQEEYWRTEAELKRVIEDQQTQLKALQAIVHQSQSVWDSNSELVAKN